MLNEMNGRSDIKTLAYVLRRTNYGEADRILNLITPEGKISAIAKGVRKAKSKLAGGVEMFSLSEMVIHQGRGELGVVTSARMIKYYDKLLVSYERLELAAMILKKVSLMAESSDSAEYFRLVDESLDGLNNGLDIGLVESWFLLNLTRVSGEEVNVYRDDAGGKLVADLRYRWDARERVLALDKNGEFGVDEIKMLRLMLTTKLAVVARVKDYQRMVPQIRNLAQTFYV